jgi:Ca-activated chloride channel family protein
MEMRIGERRILSVVQEKEQARRTYERARASGKKTALVEQQRPNLFSTAAANINSDESIEVVLEYIEEIEYRDELFELSLPLTFIPRASPSPTVGQGSGNSGAPEESDGSAIGIDAAPFVGAAHPRAPRASIAVRLTPGLPLDQIVSPTHRIVVEEQGDRYLVRPEAGPVVADRDFRLSWSPALDESPAATAFVEEREGQRYLLLMMVPPIPGSEAGLGLPTETLFIVDVSSSMAGPSIHQARQALLAALKRLRPEDRFNILRFNQDTVAFRSEFQQAVPENLEQARSWVENLKAEGGTQIYPALMRGLSMAGGSRSSHAQRIIFLTDGAVGNEQQVLQAVRERLGTVRLHTLGIGQAPNTFLMRKMASFGRGLCEFISGTERVENRIADFLSRLDRPVLTDLELTWEGVELDDLHPRTVPDLHAGEALLLSARLATEADRGRVSLGGYARTGWIETSVEVAEVGRREAGIATRWARAKVETLMDSLHEGATPFDVRAEVVEIALAHNLVTRYTSLVAVDETASAEGPSRPMRLAAALPVGGTSDPLRRLLGGALALIGLGLLALLRAGRSL